MTSPHNTTHDHELSYVDFLSNYDTPGNENGRMLLGNEAAAGRRLLGDDALRRNPPGEGGEVRLRNPGNSCNANRQSRKIRQSLRKSNTMEEVVDVVREQLNMVFKGEKKVTNIQGFQNSLKAVPFSRIQEQRLKSLEKDSLPIIQLRAKLEPQLQKLVNRQRLTVLEAGAVFNAPKSNKKHRTLFCRLSSNHRTLHYGYDVPSTDNLCPPIDVLPEKLNVGNIEGVILWRDVKKQNKSKGWDSPLGFSIEYSQPMMDVGSKTLDFMAQTNEEFEYWTDGLDVLRGKDASNDKAKQHLSMLLDMEIKIRQLDILDIEGFQLPESSPPIPQIPDNFDFHYNFN